MTETTLLTDPAHTRGDLRQMESAIRKGWALSDKLLENLPKVLVEVVAKGSMRCWKYWAAGSKNAVFRQVFAGGWTISASTPPCAGGNGMLHYTRWSKRFQMATHVILACTFDQKKRPAVASCWPKHHQLKGADNV